MKRRLIDEMKDAVDGVKSIQREIEGIDRLLNPKNKKHKLKEEDKKKVETAVKSAQEEVNKALEEYKAARSYEFPAEFSIQTAGANLLLQISDEEKKAFEKSQNEKKEEKPAEKK